MLQFLYISSAIVEAAGKNAANEMQTACGLCRVDPEDARRLGAVPCGPQLSAVVILNLYLSVRIAV